MGSTYGLWKKGFSPVTAGCFIGFYNLYGVVELRGFEPRTFALPARRSSQLSYSPLKGSNIQEFKINAN